MVRRSKEDALETRSQLLDAAEQLFSEKGVTSTTLNEIAGAAGVTRGAIYHHFKNKLHLIGALMERVMLPLDEMRSCAAANVPNDPLGQIRYRAIHVLRLAVRDTHTRSVFNILFHKCEYVDDVLPVKQRHLEGRDDCAKSVMEVFRAAIDAGQLPDHIDPKYATVGLFSFIDGLVYNWLLEPGYFALDKNAEYFVDLYVEGLRRAAPLHSAKKAQTGKTAECVSRQTK